MIIGICEDDPFFLKELRKKIEAQPQNIFQFKILEFNSGQEMLTSDAPFDLVFLDIELQEQLNGLDIASALQQRLPNVILVFISSYTKYIASAMHLPTFQFLLKPVDDQIFAEEFARCIDRYRSDHDTMTILQDGKEINLAMKDILYITTIKRKMKIYDRSYNFYEMYGKLSDWEDFLLLHHFVRVHKSFIVNCRYIKKLRSATVLLRGLQKDELITLPVSRRRKDEAQALYQNYVLEVKNK